MMPVAVKPRTSAGAARAAKSITTDPTRASQLAELIDRETGLSALADVMEEILAEAGDLIDSRAPELVAAARVALRYSGDPEPPRAE